MCVCARVCVCESVREGGWTSLASVVEGGDGVEGRGEGVESPGTPMILRRRLKGGGGRV